MVSLGLRYSAFVIIPAAAGYIVLSQPIIRLLLQHGRFLPGDTALLANVLLCYSLGLFPFTAYMFLNKVYYSLQDTKTPMVLNAIGNSANILLNLLLVRRFGVPGLALGFSLSYGIIMLLSFLHVRGRFPQFGLRGLGRYVGRFLLASSVTALASYLAFRVMSVWIGATSSADLMLGLTLAVVVGLVVYGGIGLVFRWDEPGALRQRWAAREIGSRRNHGGENGEKGDPP